MTTLTGEEKKKARSHQTMAPTYHTNCKFLARESRLEKMFLMPMTEKMTEKDTNDGEICLRMLKTETEMFLNG